MRVLVFEFVSGGGYSGQPLPAAWLAEGLLMAQALLDDFAALPDVGVVVMVDARLAGRLRTCGAQALIVGAGDDYQRRFAAALAGCDAAWPVAPETDGLLERLCAEVARQGKRLLTPPAPAVALAGDKYRTYLRLRRHRIATVPTRLLAAARPGPGPWMVKPRDGAGGERSRIVDDLAAAASAEPAPRRFIVQPHVDGVPTSLSALFRHGQARLLSLNLQQFSRVGQRYQLTGITVNHQADDGSRHRLLAQIAAACPELWGYAGVDLLETGQGCLVLEINPRLTTAYPGLAAAVGVNVAGLVLALADGLPSAPLNSNRAVRLTL